MLRVRMSGFEYQRLKQEGKRLRSADIGLNQKIH